MPKKTLKANGCEFVYEVQGQGPPVVLIQGVGVCGKAWKPQVDRLSLLHQCLTFDNRGMGGSQPAGALTIEQMAHDAIALMDAEGWYAVHVVGHSMGGLIAQQLALLAPERVRSLSLLCTFARGADATKITAQMAWIGLRTRVGLRSWRRRAFLTLVSPPGTVPADSEKLAAHVSELFGHDIGDQPPVVMKQLAAMKRHDVTSRLGELGSIRTLVVSARHDLIAPPASGRAIAAGIPNARFVELADAAHGAPILDAERINALLLEHLSGATV